MNPLFAVALTFAPVGEPCVILLECPIPTITLPTLPTIPFPTTPPPAQPPAQPPPAQPPPAQPPPGETIPETTQVTEVALTPEMIAYVISLIAALPTF